jgi:broad specificity phosphatase PhoE
VLILVRHGRTAFNAAGRLVGRLDPPLDEVGMAQAAAIGEVLKGRVDRVISSPLLRTLQTAESIGVPVEVDDQWIEVDYGEYDGVVLGSDESASLWERWRADPAFQPPGGESLAQMGLRVVTALEALLPAAADTDIAVVSHVSPIKAAVSWAIGAGAESAWRSHLDQASISRIAVTSRGPVLRSFNETWHLAGVRLES